MTINARVCLLLFSILFHWYVCLCLCQHHSLLVSIALNVVWNQEEWYSHFHSFSRLLWFFGVFCGSKQMLGLFTLFLWNTNIEILVGIAKMPSSCKYFSLSPSTLRCRLLSVGSDLDLKLSNDKPFPEF